MRLNRYLAMSGIASRRKAEDIIRAGRIAVNGIPSTDPALAVTPGADTVTLDGAPLAVEQKKRGFLLNKPTGVIVSVGDTHGRATVMDLLGNDAVGVFPVGRLDMNTSGLLLLTNDGELAHRLMHPSYEVEKVYRAEVTGRVGKSTVALFRRGIRLDDGPAAPAELRVLDSTDEVSLAEVTIHQGRKRQVRRMFAEAGHPVRTLDRISFGGLSAAGVAYGAYRSLTDRELQDLRQMVGLETDA